MNRRIILGSIVLFIACLHIYTNSCSKPISITQAARLCYDSARLKDGVVEGMSKLPLILQEYIPSLTAAGFICASTLHRSFFSRKLSLPSKKTALLGVLCWPTMKLPLVRLLTKSISHVLALPLRLFVSYIFQSEATQAQKLFSEKLETVSSFNLNEVDESGETAMSLITFSKKNTRCPKNKRAFTAFEKQMNEILSTSDTQSSSYPLLNSYCAYNHNTPSYIPQGGYNNMAKENTQKLSYPELYS